uniref:C-type LECtin n=1 Tax=Caenorhabditis tropicalis TaxID=1561998 RepID=A0A1I7UVS5_9PELO
MIALLTALLFASAIQDVTADDNNHCPSGWTFSSNTSLCYIQSPQYLTYAEADPFCQSIGGSQVFVFTLRELTWLTDFTKSSFAQPWLATTRNTTTGSWYNSDKTSPSTSFWTTGEPSLNGDCATFKGMGASGIQATPCYSIQPALCRQMPALCPTQTNYGGLSTRSGTITSPGYPVQYYNNLNCLYTITSPVNTYITLLFSPYMLEDFFDYIDVYDGPNSSYPYLGTTDDWWYIRDDFESSSNVVSFIFHTDSIITDKGWLLTWNSKSNTPPISQSGQNGSFTSPNYPNNYDPNTEQLYYITAPTGFQVNVTITDFVTELNYDVLEVYNSSYVSSYNLVANLSGLAVAPWSWVSPSKYVTMRFRSDYMIQKKGFNIVWFIQ